MAKTELSLVTGAGGFLGSHMVDLLLAKGLPVRGMIRNPAQAPELERKGVEVVVADLQKPETLDAAVKGVGHVYQIASLFRQAGLPDSTYREINTDGVKHMLDASIRAGVKRFVNCSTGGVHGHIKNPPAREDSPYNPGDIYQRTKLDGELIAMDYFREGKIRGAVIRPAMIYGPGDTRNFKMWKMIKKHIWFYVGDGKTKVHFVDVRDLVNGFYLAMTNEAINAEAFLIPGDKSVSQKYMADLIARNLKVAAPWIHIPVVPMQMLGSAVEAICTPLKINPPIYRRRVDFFTKHREFDGSKARRMLGYKPAQTFEQEIADITQWYLDHDWL